MAVGVAILAFPQGAAALAIGDFITLTTKFRLMEADLRTGIGIQEAGAKGRIVGGPIPGTKGGRVWWKVDFDNGVDGWLVSSVITSTGSGSGIPVATASLAASPSAIAAGGSATLAWSSANATSCTGTGAGFAGTRATSGSIVVKPIVSTSYGLSCTGSGGTGTATTNVTVTAPLPIVPTVSLSASPASLVIGSSSTLSWTATNVTSCTASGAGDFTGTKPISGSASVRPTVTTTYALNCTGPSGNTATSTIISVSAAGTIGASAFADPDNGNIPDRAQHPIAFPTAVGFGKATSVRSPNAVVYKINSLDDVADPADGKITYRECAMALAVTTPYAIPAGRPRYCVFDVAGAIIMNGPAEITVPKIYVAGQTSPGGIEFRLGPKYSPVDALIHSRRGGDNMILRHVRTRTGEHPDRKSDNGDPIRMSGTRYQILDHVSSMFGTDESLDMACTDCTVQWSIIGPNICRNAGHSSSLHCKTFFLKPASNVTVAYNLSEHGEQRGLNIAVGIALPPADNTGQAEIINNVLYDYIAEQGLISNQFGDVYANYIGNVSFRGPRYNSSDGNFFIGLYGANWTQPFGFSIYANGNVTPHTRIAGQFGSTTTDFFRNQAGLIANVLPSQICALTTSSNLDCSRNGKAVVQDAAYAIAPGRGGLSVKQSQIVTAEQAMRAVLAYSGADLCRDGPCRDNVDALYIDDVRTCDVAPYMYATSWPSTVVEAGGWARITAGQAQQDTDLDGMPDWWEKQFKNTNPNVWDANADADGDGYPNIEEYLNYLAKDDVRYANFLGNAAGKLPAYNCNRAQYAVQ